MKHVLRSIIVCAVGATSLFGAGIALAQTAPSLGVAMTVAPSVPAGSSQVSLADIALSASSTGPITVSSIPINASYNLASPGNFANCSIQNTAALGFPLNTGAHAMSTLGASGATFMLDTPMIVPSGVTMHIALVCSVDPATPVGGTVTVSIVPSSVVATDQTGATVSPSAALLGNGASASTMGQITVTAAGSIPTGGSTSPGLPNTGEGGNAPANIALITLSLLVAAGAFYIGNRLQHSPAA